MSEDHFPEFEAKMKKAGMSDAILRAFEHSYAALRSGGDKTIPESRIQPVADLPRMEVRVLRGTPGIQDGSGPGTGPGGNRPGNWGQNGPFS